ncbi:MAG: tRNA pseudouridine(55) synthase TruB [Rhodospirillaceae bacterium]
MARKRRGRPVHGWLVIDKPPGLTSTAVLNKARWLVGAEKAGHGGTLDPIATGVLPIAFGEATKTVAYAMDGTKCYRFRARWGEERATDDRVGDVIGNSDRRPTCSDIEAVLPRFIGDIEQVPPQYSAIKIDGERAYDIARGGDAVELVSRIVRVDRLSLIDYIDTDHAEFEVVCGKGTYMRSLARDIGRILGCLGHVDELRRFSVGRFTLDHAISLDELADLGQGAAVDSRMLPIETALDDIPALALTVAEAHRLRQGQTVALLGRQDLDRLEQLAEACAGSDGIVLATAAERPVALVRLEGAEIVPVRVFNF